MAQNPPSNPDVHLAEACFVSVELVQKAIPENSLRRGAWLLRLAGHNWWYLTVEPHGATHVGTVTRTTPGKDIVMTSMHYLCVFADGGIPDLSGHDQARPELHITMKTK